MTDRAGGNLGFLPPGECKSVLACVSTVEFPERAGRNVCERETPRSICSARDLDTLAVFCAWELYGVAVSLV